MKLLIKLTSLIIFSLSLSAQGLPDPNNPLFSSIREMQEKLGRPLTPEEAAHLVHSIQYATRTTYNSYKGASLNLACVKGQVALAEGQSTKLICLADNFSVYRIILLQYVGDTAGVTANFGVSYAYVTGYVAAALLADERRALSPLGDVFSLKSGISSSAHFGAGGDLAYFEDESGSEVYIGGLGLGAGISAGGYNQKLGSAVLTIQKLFRKSK